MTNETFPQNDAPETAPTETAPTETAKEKFERERLTRRQALKRFGMTSAMATFALFSVDDLARMVGGAMERQARNSKIAAQVAEEFQHSGVALGAVMPYYYSSPPYYYPYSSPPYYYTVTPCQKCATDKQDGFDAASAVLAGCVDGCTTPPSLAVPDPCGCLHQNVISRQAATNKAIVCCRDNGCNCGPYPYEYQ